MFLCKSNQKKHSISNKERLIIMPRKKLTETDSEQEPVEVETIASDEQELTLEKKTNTITPDLTESTKKKRSPKTPKKQVVVVIDAGRSRVKVQAFAEDIESSVIVLDSLVCETDYAPNGEIGSFTLGKKNPNAPSLAVSELTPEEKEARKDIVSHWVVGINAKYQSKEFISMTQGDDYKIKYFPILTLGAISALPNLYDLSTGSNETSRTLSIKLTTLSLANPIRLKQSLQVCKWLKIDGIKYRLSFGGAADFTGFPEGYGGALYFRATQKKALSFLTFDIGFGTATITEYSNLGKLPKRGMCSPNGGGGIASLIREFAQTVAQVDSSQSIKPSQLKEILEDARIDDGSIKAIAPDGRDIGERLGLAIGTWLKDSPITFALEKLAILGRKSPVVCCGGGFAIPPVRELVIQELVRVGVPKENLIIPNEPGIVALSEMRKLYNFTTGVDNEISNEKAA